MTTPATATVPAAEVEMVHSRQAEQQAQSPSSPLSLARQQRQADERLIMNEHAATAAADGAVSPTTPAAALSPIPKLSGFCELAASRRPPGKFSFSGFSKPLPASSVVPPKLNLHGGGAAATTAGGTAAGGGTEDDSDVLDSDSSSLDGFEDLDIEKLEKLAEHSAASSCQVHPLAVGAKVGIVSGASENKQGVVDKMEPGCDDVFVKLDGDDCVVASVRGNLVVLCECGMSGASEDAIATAADTHSQQPTAATTSTEQPPTPVRLSGSEQFLADRVTALYMPAACHSLIQKQFRLDLNSCLVSVVCRSECCVPGQAIRRCQAHQSGDRCCQNKE